MLRMKIYEIIAKSYI